MTDAELMALAAVVTTNTAAMQSENDYRRECGLQVAYSDTDFTRNPDTIALRDELVRRGVVQP